MLPALPPYIGRHHVLGLRFAQQLFVERQGLPDLVRRDLADGEPDVVQDVIARDDRFIDHIQPGFPPGTPEIHDSGDAVDFHHSTRNSEAHMAHLHREKC